MVCIFAVCQIVVHENYTLGSVNKAAVSKNYSALFAILVGTSAKAVISMALCAWRITSKVTKQNFVTIVNATFLNIDLNQIKREKLLIWFGLYTLFIGVV